MQIVLKKINKVFNGARWAVRRQTASVRRVTLQRRKNTDELFSRVLSIFLISY